MNKELKYKKEMHKRWKKRRVTWKGYTGIVRTYKFRIGKSKAQLELKGNKKDI